MIAKKHRKVRKFAAPTFRKSGQYCTASGNSFEQNIDMQQVQHKSDWRLLAEQASKETDCGKLNDLVQELIHNLDEDRKPKFAQRLSNGASESASAPSTALDQTEEASNDRIMHTTTEFTDSKRA